jgi:hypothetical protein
MIATASDTRSRKMEEKEKSLKEEIVQMRWKYLQAKKKYGSKDPATLAYKEALELFEFAKKVEDRNKNKE